MLETILRNEAHSLLLAEQAFLFMVFSLGALMKNDTRSEIFYKQCQSVAMQVFSDTSAESTAFAFLMCLYEQSTGRISAAWTTFGVVVKLAQALGCLSQ
jgi:hypothetical protein